VHSPSSYSCNIPYLHGTWVHEPQILCHGNWHFEFGHTEVLSKEIRASQVWKAGRCIGLFLQGCIGQGMVMVWSWYVYPRRVERYVHPYIITTYTHTCVYVITFISPGNASHVNILCTCTPLYTLSERYTCISYRSRLADIPLLCVAVCGMWVLDQL
jgi:hypothetical protein